MQLHQWLRRAKRARVRAVHFGGPLCGLYVFTVYGGDLLLPSGLASECNPLAKGPVGKAMTPFPSPRIHRCS